jgi:uncharacterized membrane protein YdjX (TVP38/TMEM64 family)
MGGVFKDLNMPQNKFGAPVSKLRDAWLKPAPEIARKRKIWFFGFCIIVLLLLFYRGPVMKWVAFISDQDAFSAYVLDHGWWGPLVVGCYLALQTIVSLLPGQALVIAAGYIYGFWRGSLLSIVVIVLASQLAFGLGRWGGRPLVIRLAPERVVDKWDEAAEKYGFYFFLVSFLLPIFPADTMNYIAGLSSINGWKFLAASLLGRIPVLMFQVAIGAFGIQLLSRHVPYWVFGLFLFINLFLYWFWNYLFRKKDSKHESIP